MESVRQRRRSVEGANDVVSLAEASARRTQLGLYRSKQNSVCSTRTQENSKCHDYYYYYYSLLFDTLISEFFCCILRFHCFAIEHYAFRSKYISVNFCTVRC